ncbi:MAG: hypothetical protein AB1798_04970, partial [Spirochaetota bacterium]
MRRLISCAVFIVLAISGNTETNEVIAPPFVPLIPEIMGQGGASTAIAHGYNSLFTNPAGFGRKGGSLTIVSANPWIYSRPDKTFDAIKSLVSRGSSPAFFSFLNDQLV